MVRYKVIAAFVNYYFLKLFFVALKISKSVLVSLYLSGTAEGEGLVGL